MLISVIVGIKDLILVIVVGYWYFFCGEIGVNGKVFVCVCFCNRVKVLISVVELFVF